MKKDIEFYEYDETKVYEPSKTLFCYLRVSTQQQVVEGNSIDNQFHSGLRVSEMLGKTLCVLNEGGTSSVDRDSKTKFFLLQNLIQQKKLKHLWYYSRSRWSRTKLEDLVIKNNYFKPFNVKVYEGEGGSERNFTDPNENFVDDILTGVQQLDRENRRLVSVSGKRHLSRMYGDKSVFLGGTPRFGYKNENKTWVINKEESDWVKKIFKWYLSGKSTKWIKQELDTNGVSPRRSKTWNLGTLRMMLNNEGYTGHYKWIDKETEESFHIQIPQIISISQFKKVQRVIKRNQKNKGNNLRKYESLLSDFLICSCGESITGNINRGRRKSGEQINSEVYICSSRSNYWKGKKVNPCENRRTLNMNKTDEFVLSNINDVVNDSSTLKERFKVDVLKDKNKQEKEILEEKKILERRIRDYDSQLDLTTESISKVEVNNMLGKGDKKIYPKLIRNLTDEQVRLEGLRTTTIGEIESLDSKKEWVDWVGKFGKSIEKDLKSKRYETIQGLIKDLIVSPTFGNNRDKERKQVGHRIKINFKLPIVNDELLWKDKKDKSKGYELKNGKKTFITEEIPVNVGGRPKKKLK
ncbi:recombinase family protein [Pseudomonadota bacterium]|nr:recombinase family protein [Pseudomonadota bacterium]